MSLLEVHDLHVTYAAGAGVTGPGGARRGSRARRGRDARAGGRVGLRQVVARRRAAAAAAEGHRGHGRRAPRRRGRARDEAGPAARRALDRAGDRLPGRAPHAQPGAARGRPDRRGDPAALEGRGGNVSKRVGELLELVGLPARRGARLPARAVGRPAPARADRAGAGVRAEAVDRRRAHHRARRDGPGAGPAAARGPPERARARDRLHHARPLDARRRLPPDRGHVRGPDRRGGAERHGLRRRRASLHAGARRGLPRDRRPGIPHEPVGPAGRSARPARRCRAGCPFHPRCSVGRRHLPEHARGAVAGRAKGARPPVSTCPARRWPRERRHPAARGTRPPRGVPRSRRPGARRRRREPDARRGRDARARGRVRLRQDHARPHDHGPAVADGRRGSLPRRAARLQPCRRCASTAAARR